MKNYILDGKTPVVENDLMKWASWFQGANRIVKSDMIDGVHVSTVFLGVDHAYGGATPLLFETMIFGGSQNGYQDRYSTWEEAEKGHQEAIELVKDEVKCSCGATALPLHTCPYAEEINDDSEKMCNCCQECIENCQMDI